MSELRNAFLTDLEWDLRFELEKDKMLGLLSKTCTKQVKYTNEERLSSRSSLSSRIAADVIFVHGLRGGPFMTWRQQEKKAAKKDGTDCWPKVFACKLCDVTYLATYKHVRKKFHNSKYYSLVSSFSCETLKIQA